MNNLARDPDRDLARESDRDLDGDVARVLDVDPGRGPDRDSDADRDCDSDPGPDPGTAPAPTPDRGLGRPSDGEPVPEPVRQSHRHPQPARQPARQPVPASTSPISKAALVRHAVRWLRTTVGLALGAGTAVLELLGTVVGGLVLLPVLAWPRGRRAVLRPVTAVGRVLVRLERRRLDRFFGVRLPGAHEDGEALRYLAARWPLGLLGVVVLGCVAYGLGLGTFAFYGWLITDIEHGWLVAFGSLGGFFLLFLSVQGALGVCSLEEQLARHLLGPSHAHALEARIAQLATSRAEVMDVVHEERRRIERDLHDGVQQRLVALGMLLGRARRLRARDPERADELLLQAHEESRRALTELREVAWRVYPTVLDEAGLRAALESVAERSPLPVGLAYAVERPLPRTVETVAYFVVSEAVTNVVKHAGATRIDVHVTVEEGELSVRVTDDGAGGADASGSGLSGLASRAAALDGRFAVHSPAGGPTVVRAVLPCG
ncbi:histidine kinase [Streptomyces sp. NPDC003035]|uniref:histidine kinase n=1 Tax=Streptomyces sp. NPDC003035 TaxID=3364676 RepID=UPI0036CBC053